MITLSCIKCKQGVQIKMGIPLNQLQEYHLFQTHKLFSTCPHLSITRYISWKPTRRILFLYIRVHIIDLFYLSFYTDPLYPTLYIIHFMIRSLSDDFYSANFTFTGWKPVFNRVAALYTDLPKQIFFSNFISFFKDFQLWV